MRSSAIWYSVLSLALFAGSWEILHLLLNSFILPSPLEVLNEMMRLFFSTEIFPHIAASLKRTLVGFLIGLSLGSIFGTISGMNFHFQKIVEPILEVLRPIPPIAWIPLAILWFGVGDAASFFIIFIAAFYPIFTNVYFGISSLPRIYRQVKEVFRLNNWQYIRHIIAPFTAPFLLSGAKVAIGFSWMAVIAAEIISANEGLGYLIEINRVLLQTQTVIAAMLTIGFIGYALNFIILRIEKKVTSWRPTAHEQ